MAKPKRNLINKHITNCIFLHNGLRGTNLFLIKHTLIYKLKNNLLKQRLIKVFKNVSEKFLSII